MGDPENGWLDKLIDWIDDFVTWVDNHGPWAVWFTVDATSSIVYRGWFHGELERFVQTVPEDSRHRVAIHPAWWKP